MPAQPIAIHVVTQHLEGEALLAEPLLFPEVLVCHVFESPLRASVRRLTADLAAGVPPLEWSRHVLPQTPTKGVFKVIIDPPKKQTAWSSPLECTFDYFWWTHGDQAVIAYVPALQIEIIADTHEHLLSIAPAQLRSALRRTAAGDSLYRMAQLRRVESVSLETMEIVISIPSPRQRHIDEASEQNKAKKSLISQIGQVLSNDAFLEPAYEVDGVVVRLAEMLGGQSPRSVLLVGPAGVGKSAAVRELVRRQQAMGLGSKVFWSTSGARLVAGMSGFGMWQERCTQLCSEAKAASAIVHFGSLYELMEVGRSESNSQGIAGFLKPQLIRAELLAICECTPEQLTIIERADAHLLDAFQVIKVQEPTNEVGRSILRQRIEALGRGGLVRIDDAGLLGLDRLHRRYAGYSAYPSRPLRFVQNLIHDLFSRHPDGLPDPVVLSTPEVTATFARQTGLPLFLLDDDLPLDMRQSHETFSRRVIGQTDAVNLVTDLIATVKAGLGRPRRPIASLLFIGPTGVGKTEMAKALAEFFFNSTDRMTRFDMSEFATAIDVQRLVGGVMGAEGLLTAKVREQPFSVVLLDEVEKAHPLLFDLLLQVLGEGRLTDAAGRVADFTNAVVIMTSNLGAETFQRGGFGFRPTAGSAQDAKTHFIDEVRAFLRPEMFNRIDRIVPFLPLDEPTVLKIVRRELDLVGVRDGILLRGVAFDPGDDVVQYLARKGYDRTYGARPLKRLIERELLVPLGDGINGYADNQRLVADVSVAPSGRLSVNVRGIAEDVAAARSNNARWAEAAKSVATLRRKIQQFFRTTALLNAQNELYALRRAEEMAAKYARNPEKPAPFDLERSRRMNRLSAVTDTADRLRSAVIDMEDQALDVVYGSNARAESPEKIDAERLAADGTFFDLLAALYELRYPDPHRVTLAFFGEKESRLCELANAYIRLAGADAKLTAGYFRRPGPDELDRYSFLDFRGVFESMPPKGEGFILEIRAPHAMLRFQGESGLHVFQILKDADEVYVEATMLEPHQFVIPEPIRKREALQGIRKRRQYFLERAAAKDSMMTGELRWAGGGLVDAIAEGMTHARLTTLASLLTEEQEAKAS